MYGGDGATGPESRTLFRNFLVAVIVALAVSTVMYVTHCEIQCDKTLAEHAHEN